MVFIRKVHDVLRRLFIGKSFGFLTGKTLFYWIFRRYKN